MPSREWDEEADFIVVGSGAAGATAGLDLARAGREVVLLEEGGWFRQPDFRPDFYSALSRLWRDFGGQAARGRSVFPVAQGCCVGGSTTINTAIMHRMPRDVWEVWTRDAGLREQLPWDQIEEAGEAIESDLSVRANLEAILPGLPLSASLDRLGWRYRAMPRAATGCQSSTRCLQGCPSGGKWSLEKSFVPAAVEHGARVVARCRVDRVLIEAGRAVGVEAELHAEEGARRRYRARARRGVVVAAGAVHSPLLLQRSGLRNPHIGRHFLCHIGTNVVAEYERPTAAIEGPSMGYEVLHASGLKFSSIQSTPPEILVGNVPSVGADLVALLRRIDRLCLWNTSFRCSTEGDVRRSLVGGPRIRLTPSAADIASARAGVGHLAELLFAAGAVAVHPGINGIPRTLTSPDQIGVVASASLDPRDYALNCSHLFGTCRLASRASDGAVAPSFQTHEVTSLYVVDASVFPTATGVNPQQSIMALARHAVRGILQ